MNIKLWAFTHKGIVNCKWKTGAKLFCKNGDSYQRWLRYGPNWNSIIAPYITGMIIDFSTMNHSMRQLAVCTVLRFFQRKYRELVSFWPSGQFALSHAIRPFIKCCCWQPHVTDRSPWSIRSWVLQWKIEHWKVSGFLWTVLICKLYQIQIYNAVNFEWKCNGPADFEKVRSVNLWALHSPSKLYFNWHSPHHSWHNIIPK